MKCFPMGTAGSESDDLLESMLFLLEQSKKADNIREIEKIEQESNSLLSETIKCMNESKYEQSLVEKMIDIHREIINL